MPVCQNNNFVFKDPRWALYDLSRHAVSHGDQVSPRGMLTYELQFATIHIIDTAACIPEGMSRKFNTRLAALETLSLLGGFASPEMTVAVAPDFMKYTGGGMTGAYGPRIKGQMPYVINMLLRDKDTRQAVVAIWDPQKDLMVEHGDRPCTTQIGFMIRDDKLITNTMMRSQDIFLGLPYDLVMFTQLHHTVANLLNIEPGPLVHQVRSLHVYERNLQQISEMTTPDEVPMTRLLGLPAVSSWDDVIDEAQFLAFNNVNADDGLKSYMSSTELWFAEKMKAVREKVLAS